MRMLNFNNYVILCMFIAISLNSTAQAQDVNITAYVKGEPLTIGASTSRFAGAIDSLTYRGTQYINTSDHGREWQSASSFDNFGECFNPTQAGSLTDGSGSTSTSVVLSLSNANNVLTGKTQMAFWLPPGYNYGRPCGSSSATTAQNKTSRSNHILTQTVTIGYAGVLNLIGYNTSFYVAEAHTNGAFEAGTAYMPSTFNKFLTYNRATKTLSAVTANSSGSTSTVPVIISTSNGENALGMISPTSSGMHYEYYYFSGDTSKQGCVFGKGAIAAGTTFNFSCPAAIGTVDEVIAAMNAYPTSTADTHTPVFRFHNSIHHFYSTSYTEGQSTGYYTFETTDFHLFPSRGNGAYVPLYRCYVSGSLDHFLSTSSTCEGSNVEGILGYLSPVPASGLIPLYRFFRSNGGDHLITTNYNEGPANGYTYEGTLGYVPTT